VLKFYKIDPALSRLAFGNERLGIGGSSFEDAQWNHFLGKVGGFCKVGR
jgi:hypothetical protein